MIKKIRLQGLLSFEDMELELRNLNVLIGPNGSGKSNLIEALSLLQALPTDIGEPIRRGGGIGEWIRKALIRPERATIGMVMAPRPTDRGIGDSAYSVALRDDQGKYEIAQETLISLSPQLTEPLLTYEVELGTGFIAVPITGLEEVAPVPIALKSSRQSALRERRDSTPYYDLPEVADQLSAIRLYRSWIFGKDAWPRQHQPADLPPDFLNESTDNLALVINEFDNMRIKEEVEAEFRRFYNRCERLSVSIFGNRIILNMHEEGLSQPIPATRWSDGMIRYLCLLAILCHPNPPGLICIDEPELGFHPDILPNLARLIKAASERTQIIITTHSKQLVDEFSDDPEVVVVCERGFEGETTMRRLDATELHDWLEEYSLGDLWEKGEIGGDLY